MKIKEQEKRLTLNEHDDDDDDFDEMRGQQNIKFFWYSFKNISWSIVLFETLHMRMLSIVIFL